jgi:2-polyprenyl-3-methyl-5-hydroxy-6-metoxy-1,4-benzoquinol methylase
MEILWVQYMDWRIKAVTQAGLAAIPGGTTVNDLLQRLVGARRPGLVQQKISSKLAELRLMLRALRECGFEVANARVLEIGTGWDPTIPIYLAGLGAQVTSVDLRRHLRATRSVREKLQATLDRVRQEVDFSERHRGAIAAFIAGHGSVEDLLTGMDIAYLAPFLDATLLSLPPLSFDLVYSIAVLEHVSPLDLDTMMHAHDHLLRPGAVAYHDIALGDHFTGVDSAITSANFLKYDGLFWRWLGENHLAYHNRLRKSDFERLFAAHGYSMRWSEHKIDQHALELIRSGRLRPIRRYADYSVEDLATWRFRAIVAAGPRPAS